jgi:hypothetical protein
MLLLHEGVSPCTRRPRELSKRSFTRLGEMTASRSYAVLSTLEAGAAAVKRTKQSADDAAD